MCETSSEWTPMPQPLVVDSSAAETVTPSTRFPNRKTVESEGSKRRQVHTTADGSTLENNGKNTLTMSTSDGSQLTKVTFQVAKINKALGSVSKMLRNGNVNTQRVQMRTLCPHISLHSFLVPHLWLNVSLIVCPK